MNIKLIVIKIRKLILNNLLDNEINIGNQFMNLSDNDIENNIKDLQKQKITLEKWQKSQLVSHITTTNIVSKYPPIVPKTTFVSFWGSLNELGKALFIGFLSTAAVSVVGTIGYGIYKGVKNNWKESEEKIENKENTEENNKAEIQSGPGDYKLTLIITKEDQKNKEWSVYSAGGPGFEEPKKIGSLGEEQNSEDGKMKNDGNGKFSFTFKKVKDPNHVTVIVKIGNSGNEQTAPFTLGKFINSDNDSNKIYFYGDSEENSDNTNFKPKNNAQPIGNISVIKTKSSNNTSELKKVSISK